MGENCVVSNMNLERVLSMKGGKGEDSYHNNSQAQVQYFFSIFVRDHDRTYKMTSSTYIITTDYETFSKK